MSQPQQSARKFAASFAVISLVVFGASGCATAQPTTSPSATATPTPTQTPLTDAQALAAFKSIAEALGVTASEEGFP